MKNCHFNPFEPCCRLLNYMFHRNDTKKQDSLYFYIKIGYEITPSFTNLFQPIMLWHPAVTWSSVFSGVQRSLVELRLGVCDSKPYSQTVTMLYWFFLITHPEFNGVLCHFSLNFCFCCRCVFLQYVCVCVCVFRTSSLCSEPFSVLCLVLPVWFGLLMLGVITCKPKPV